MKSRTDTVSPAIRESNLRADEVREARITVLEAIAHSALASGDGAEFRRLQRELKAAVLARSPDQVARMRQLAMEGTS